MKLLKIDPNDPQQEQKELEFDVECALEIKQEDRIRHWADWNLRMLEWFYSLHGHQTTPKIVKRV